MQSEPVFIGINAPLSAHLTLLAYILLIVPSMLIGFYFARRKWFEPHHKLTMTAITIFNWFLILFVMAVSYSDNVAPSVPDGLNDKFVFLPTIHMILGASAQLLATYLVIRMWFEKVLPSWFMVKRIKRYMRLTLILWLLTATFGAITYVTWYVDFDSAGGGVPIPVTTEEAPGAVTTEEANAPVTTEEAPDVVLTEETPDVTTTEEAVLPVATEEALVPASTTEEALVPVATEESIAPTAAPEPVSTEEAASVSPATTEESTCVEDEQYACELEYYGELADCSNEDADKQGECRQEVETERSECLARVADRCD